jgi:hypothetical protein
MVLFDVDAAVVAQLWTEGTRDNLPFFACLGQQDVTNWCNEKAASLFVAFLQLLTSFPWRLTRKSPDVLMGEEEVTDKKETSLRSLRSQREGLFPFGA